MLLKQANSCFVRPSTRDAQSREPVSHRERHMPQRIRPKRPDATRVSERRDASLYMPWARIGCRAPHLSLVSQQSWHKLDSRLCQTVATSLAGFAVKSSVDGETRMKAEKASVGPVCEGERPVVTREHKKGRLVLVKESMNGASCVRHLFETRNSVLDGSDSSSGVRGRATSVLCSGLFVASPTRGCTKIS